MKKLTRKLLLIFLFISISLFLFGCNNEDELESLDKPKDTIKDVKEVEVKIEEYNIIKSLERHGIELETPEIDIFNVKDDVLIFGIRNPTIKIEDITKATEFGPPITHLKLMKYDLNKDILSEIYQFETPIHCYDVAIKGILAALNTGKLKVPGIPIKFSCTPGKIRRTAPLLGEHTDEILKELLDMDSEEIKRLKNENVF